MNIVNEAYIVEWEAGKYVVTHDDHRSEFDRQFLGHGGYDFYCKAQLPTVGIPPIPFFDTILEAETAWDDYKVLRDEFLLDLSRRKIKIKKLI